MTCGAVCTGGNCKTFFFSYVKNDWTLQSCRSACETYQSVPHLISHPNIISRIGELLNVHPHIYVMCAALRLVILSLGMWSIVQLADSTVLQADVRCSVPSCKYCQNDSLVSWIMYLTFSLLALQLTCVLRRTRKFLFAQQINAIVVRAYKVFNFCSVFPDKTCLFCRTITRFRHRQQP
jgi:hypothetical protein